MKTTQPVRDIVELKKIKKYYREVKPNKRNFLLIICGLNTALRISDILKLRWKDVYNENLLSFKSHIDVKEQKTGKKTTVFIFRLPVVFPPNRRRSWQSWRRL